MRTLAALGLVLCLLGTAQAGSRRCVKSAAGLVPSGLIVTPFAIPVAVPVATVPAAPVQFGYAPGATAATSTATAASSASCGCSKCQCAAAETATAQAQPAAESPGPVAPSLVQQKCGTCHTRPGAKGGFSLFARHEFGPVVVEPLSPEQRLACIDQIVQQKMPKGGTLSPAEIGELVQWFSAAPPNSEKE